LFRAQSMTNAFVCVDNRCFAIDQGQYIALGADRDACAASYARVGENVRMLCLRSLRKERALFSMGARCRLFGFVLAPVANQKETQNASGNQPCEQSLHRSMQPHASEAQSQNHRDVNQCENGEGIAERAMNHMPKVKDFLGLVEKDHALRE